MGLFDAIFGASSNNTTTTTKLPAYLEAALKSLTSGSFPIANQGYQTYGGPRVAPLNQDQQASFDVTRGGIGGYDPYAAQAGSYIQSAAGPFNQSEFESYLSPYTEGVVNRIGDLGARNLSEKLLPQVNTTFTGAGQFGSSRHADFTGRALRDTQESVLGQQQGALENAYNSAMKNYQDAQGRRLTAGTDYANLGTAAQGANLKDAAALEAIGRTQQGQTQSNLDTAYQDFMAQQNYPKEQANWLAGILAGQPYSKTQTTSGGQSPGLLGQLGGLATGIGSLGQAFPGTGSGPFGWFKRGGPVKAGVSGGIGSMPVRRGPGGMSKRVAKGKRSPARRPMPLAGIGGMSHGLTTMSMGG